MSSDEPAPSAVAVVRCADYTPEATFAAAEQALNLLRIGPGFLPDSGHVLLKPNLLSRREPGRAVTTHPAILEALIKALRGRKPGIDIRIGDSPGGALKRIQSYWDKAGWTALAERTGVPLVSFDDAGSESFDASGFPDLGSFTISKAALEPAMLINVPKLKTHSLTFMTCAMKNLYGLIPGLQKGRIHKAIPDQASFSRFIAHLNTCVKPALHVVDAVVAMEGNGPASGTPRPLGLILAGFNPVAVDMIAAAIIGIPFDRVGHIREGIAAGLGPAGMEAIEVRGEAIDTAKAAGFRLPSSYHLRRIFSGVFIRLLRRFAWIRPRVDMNLCKRCRKCIEACPVQAMTLGDEALTIDYKHCITCMCCHELCDENAVKLETSLLVRLFFDTKDYGRKE